jgi:hypothetical protein
MMIKLSHKSIDRIREIYMDKTKGADARDFCADILRRTACFDLPIDCDKGHKVTLSKETLQQLIAVVVEDTCVRQVEYAGVLRGAPHPELARQLVEFMLSSEWQSALPSSNFVDPVVPGTPRPPEFERWAARPAAPLDLPVDRIGAERDQWIEQWRTIME